jgi:hypothetical protein
MIKENLISLRDSFKALGGNAAWLLYDFVLRYGKVYGGEPLPKRYIRRAPKACFYNARGLVLAAKGLEYCEGYVLRADLGIPIHHAWAVKAGKVIDPTLRDPENCEYLGITFDRRYLEPSLRYSGQLLTAYEGLRVDFLKGLYPEYAPVIEQAIANRFKTSIPPIPPMISEKEKT